MSQARTCRACGVSIAPSATAPRFCPDCGVATPIAESSAPVVTPTAPPQGIPTRAPTVTPTVAPAARSGTPAIRPRSQASSPRMAGQTGAPGRQAAPRKSQGSRRPAGSSAGARSEQIPAARPLKKKDGMTPGVLAAMGGGLLLIVVAVVLSSGGGEPAAPRTETRAGSGGGAGSEEPFSWERETARIVAKATGRKSEPTSAAEAWEDAQKIARTAAGYSMSPDLQRRLQRVADEREDRALALDPDFAPWHEKEGNRHYDGRFRDWTHATWLSPGNREKAERLHAALETVTAELKGWGPKAAFKAHDAFLDDLGSLPATVAELETSVWGKNVLDQFEEAVSEVEASFAKQKHLKFRGLTIQISEPYALFMEIDDGWVVEDQARIAGEKLSKPLNVLLGKYGAFADMNRLTDPVPVLIFRSQRHYNTYRTEGNDPDATVSLAHYETDTGRLAFQKDSVDTTLFHEATHQAIFALMAGASNGRIGLGEESFWFHEGFAEWQAAEYGVDEKHVLGLAAVATNPFFRQALFTLPELIDTHYGMRHTLGGGLRMSLVYSQGWLIIHYLKHCNADAEGRVDPTKPGKYAAAWERYVRYQLTHGGGGKAKFLEVMGLDESEFAAMAEECSRWHQFLMRKMRKKQVNRDGSLMRDVATDRLPAYSKTTSVMPDPSEDRSPPQPEGGVTYEILVDENGNVIGVRERREKKDGK